jgi:hypothetical protein
MAKGELLVFVDDDDMAEPTYVSTLVTALLRSGGDAVTAGMQTHASDDGPLEDESASGTWVFLGNAVHLAPMVNCLGGAAAIIKKSALDAVGGYHTTREVGHEDWNLYARLLLKGRVVYSAPEVLYRYRHRSGSMIRRNDPYQNARVVFSAFEPELPTLLRNWPEILRGLHEALEQSRRAEAQAREESDHLLRYFATLELAAGRDVEPLERMAKDVRGRDDRRSPSGDSTQREEMVEE